MGLRSWGRNYVTGIFLRKAYEGDFGKFPKWAVEHLGEIGTDLGILLALVAGCIWTADRTGACGLAAQWVSNVHIDCPAWATSVEHLSAESAVIFGYLGQQAGSLHLEPPTK